MLDLANVSEEIGQLSMACWVCFEHYLCHDINNCPEMRAYISSTIFHKAIFDCNTFKVSHTHCLWLNRQGSTIKTSLVLYNTPSHSVKISLENEEGDQSVGKSRLWHFSPLNVSVVYISTHRAYIEVPSHIYEISFSKPEIEGLEKNRNWSQTWGNKLTTPSLFIIQFQLIPKRFQYQNQINVQLEIS